MKLSIIIPVFNEEKTIATVIDHISSLVIPHVVIEIIVINDGSTDNTASIISNSQFPISNARIVHHKKNYGKGQAVRTGIRHATGEYILIQDADTEYNPGDIIRLIEPVQHGKAQVVYGTRLKRLPHFNKEERTFQFFIHYVGNKGLSFLTSALYGQWITDMETGYKLFPKKAVSSIQLHSIGFEFEAEITAKLLKAGYKIHEVPITTAPRGYLEGKKLRTIEDGTKALMTLIKYKFS